MGLKVNGVVFYVLTMLVALVVSRESKAVSSRSVTYDGRALIIDGMRRVLFSGSIHYPRSTPEMWPSLIAKAKEGGIDVIQTYVFWNAHEPIQGQYNFEGRFDLVKFIKEIQAQGLYVSLRIGPFIEAEWQYGGLPFWLHDIPGITFRCNNEPFKYHMQRFVTKIVGMMKAESLFYPQGGPIIISQIENEYQNVEPAFHELGPPYVKWAASMAVGLNTGVPWVMCKQDDAPDPVINACNGVSCGETWSGPNSPNKPALWTENWTTIFSLQKYGKQPRNRPAKELAFTAALFIAKKNGSFVNYYMYHGGTNFGRTASPYVTTSYYDLAPLDEYGLVWQPTWAHLKELHAAIKQSSQSLLYGTYSNFSLGFLKEAHVFQTKSDCIAFLVNFNLHGKADVQFRNKNYQLPARSVIILSQCNKIIFNTAEVTTQGSTRSSKVLQSFNDASKWSWTSDKIPDFYDGKFTNKLLDQLSTTKDATDYLWYITRYNSTSEGSNQVLHVESDAHVIHAFVNYKLVGKAHGNDQNPSATLDANFVPNKGENTISLLSVMVGSPDAGPHVERKYTGLHTVKVDGTEKHSNPIDLSNQVWSYMVGRYGEQYKIYSMEGSTRVQWRKDSLQNSRNQPLRWYKTIFDLPDGSDPVALNLTSMGKGEVWVNGESIGRYWVSFKAANGQPSQALYHVPRSFLQPSGNFLVLFEEEGGNPLEITVNTISVTNTQRNDDEHLIPGQSSYQTEYNAAIGG
ncbi:hypothetical protein LUZ63_003042 [Rhynchospora breviuscula]|uniref:Beta-galactosidase n=1 Tax=Rhynchospora breviuscula TaxID=2022672 RepID=A0A9Q0D0I6_9POAL|nr:hypothetical protein LUZ63_003042 [Rhynchospora breviuscula]